MRCGDGEALGWQAVGIACLSSRCREHLANPGLLLTPRSDDEAPWTQLNRYHASRKATKLQFESNRTANRHRWAGWEFKQALSERTLRKWTRQIDTVTLGAADVSAVKDLLRKPRGSATGGHDCLLKTQHSANNESGRQGVTSSGAGRHWRWYRSKPPERGRNYNGPKVANSCRVSSDPHEWRNDGLGTGSSWDSIVEVVVKMQSTRC